MLTYLGPNEIDEWFAMDLFENMPQDKTDL